MNISGRSCFRGIEIGMRVDPDDSDLLVFGRTANRSDRKAMVTAKHQWEAPALDGGSYCSRDAPSHWDNTIEILEFWICDTARFLNRHFDIASVIQGVAQLFELFMQMCISYRAGAHIHPAAICSEINGDTDNVYLH